MAGCCAHEPKFEGLSQAYRRALCLVIAINAAMFVVEMTAAAMAGLFLWSTAQIIAQAMDQLAAARALAEPHRR